MITKVAAILGIATICTTIFSCITTPDYPDEPVLEFVSFSKSSILQGRTANDSVFITLKLTDGDGDIGSETLANLKLIDNRTGDPYTQYRIPTIPEAGANNGIEATIRLKVYNTCCLQPDGMENCEDVTVASNQLSFNISLTDNAGNTSQPVSTPVINLTCF